MEAMSGWGGHGPLEITLGGHGGGDAQFLPNLRSAVLIETMFIKKRVNQTSYSH